MKTHKFARKPFYVDAVRVSEENLEDTAKWCQGEVIDSEGEDRHIKVRVHRPLTDRQTKAFVGDWVLYAGTGFKVYTPKAFDKSFEKVKTLTKAQADEAGIKVPHEKSQRPRRPKPPANPVISEEKANQLKKLSEEGRPTIVTDEKGSEGFEKGNVVVNVTSKDDEAEKLIREVLRG